MRKFFSILVLAFLLLGTTPVRSELDDLSLGQLIRRAWECGNLLQNVRALQIDEHYPYLRYRFLTYAKSRGALDWELEILSAVYEAAVTSAAKNGIYLGGSYGKFINKETKEYYLKKFNNVLQDCAR